MTESLEQQTATAEILRVISSSPTDVQPVFEAIVENAARLSARGRRTCSASTASFFTSEPFGDRSEVTRGVWHVSDPALI